MIQAALRQPIPGVEARGERRESTRFQIALPLSIHSLQLDGVSQELSGKTVDISGRGIYFVTDAPLTAGTRLILAITLPRQRTSPASIVARARVCVVRSEKVWHEGERRVGVAAEIEHYCL